MRLKELYQSSNQNLETLKDLNLPKKKRLTILLLSYLLSLIVVIGPFAFLLNCLIFDQVFLLVVFGLLVIVIAFLYLKEIFYYKMLQNTFESVKELSFKPNYLMNLIIYSIMVLVLFLVFMIFYLVGRNLF